MANAILGRYAIDLGTSLAPPQLYECYNYTAGTWSPSSLPVVTDSNWTGTGPQILGTSSSKSTYIDVTGYDSTFSGVKWTVLNLKPKAYSAACELYTPYLDLDEIISTWGVDTSPLYPSNEVEFFWNPVRQVYQTAIPEHTGKMDDVDCDITVMYINQSLTRNSVSRAIKWKFQMPTKLILGTSSGLFVNYKSGASAGSSDNVINCQSDYMFRMPDIYGTDISELVTRMYMGTAWTATFPSIDAQALTLLRICVSKDSYDIDTTQASYIQQLQVGFLQKAPIDECK